MLLPSRHLGRSPGFRCMLRLTTIRAANSTRVGTGSLGDLIKLLIISMSVSSRRGLYRATCEKLTLKRVIMLSASQLIV